MTSIRERMAESNPSVTQFWRDLAASHNNAGYLLNTMNQKSDALAAYRRAAGILERLSHDSSSTIVFQADLASIHDNIGILLGEMDVDAEALKSYQRALEIRERLSRDHPTVLVHQSNLATTFVNMGALLSKSARSDEAMESYRGAELILERLSRENPSSLSYQSSLAVCIHNMAEIEMTRGQWTSARDRFERAIALQRAALAVLPGNPLYQFYLKGHLFFQAKTQRALGQTGESLKSARELATLARGNPSELYNAACALASIIPQTGDNERQALAVEAVRTLREAIAAGWKDTAKASRDQDFAALHDRDDFRRAFAQLFDQSFPANPFAP